MIVLQADGRVLCEKCGNVWTPGYEGRIPKRCIACCHHFQARVAPRTKGQYIDDVARRPRTNLLRLLANLTSPAEAQLAQYNQLSKEEIAAKILAAHETERKSYGYGH